MRDPSRKVFPEGARLDLIVALNAYDALATYTKTPPADPEGGRE